MATTVTTVPYRTLTEVPAVVIPPQRPPPNACAMKCLAITQLIIGIITLLCGVLGVASLTGWPSNAGSGIWSGIWITTTGIIGICSTRSLNLGNLNGVYMAFSIISTCASGLAGLFFIIAVENYSTCEQWIYGPERDCDVFVGLALNVPLLILMIVEFFVSIIAAVFASQNGCCRGSQPGVIVQQQLPPQMTIVTTSGGQTSHPGVAQYPGQMAPQYGGQMAPQYGGQMAPQYGGQMAPQYGGQMAAPYNPEMLPPHGGQRDFTQTQKTNVDSTEKPPEYNGAQF